MTKFFAAIIAFLLMLFPESGTLLIYQQQLAFPGEKVVAEEIIDAIKETDVETLINMYSESAKSTGEVTEENIKKLIESFDGNVEYGSFVSADGGEHFANGSGTIDRNIKLKIKTTQKEYTMYAIWQVADTESPEKVGLIQLVLYPYIWEETRTPIVSMPSKDSLINAGY